MENDEKIHTETVVVAGEDLLAKVKEIVHEGNVRRITLTSEEGTKLMSIPPHARSGRGRATTRLRRHRRHRRRCHQVHNRHRTHS